MYTNISMFERLNLDKEHSQKHDKSIRKDVFND